jgi:hypothetical protein
MNQSIELTQLLMIKTVCFIAFIVALVCLWAYLDCRKMCKWYKSKYHAEPRIRGHEPRMSRMQRIFDSIFLLPKL